METTSISPPTEPMNGHDHASPACQAALVPVSEVLAQIGGKWTIHVITILGHGPMRFSELRRTIGDVSQKMLTSTLRDLERDGFVSRKVTPTIPPRVDYALTEMGRELLEPLQALSRWAYINRERVSEARDRFAVREAERRQLSW